MIIHARATTPDQPPRLAIAFGKPGGHKGGKGRHPAIQLCACNRNRWKPRIRGALFERRYRGFLGCFGGRFAVAQHGGLIAEDLLGVVELRAFQGIKLFNFGKRQFGEKSQEAPDIRVCRISPELIIIVWRKTGFVKPDGALRGFAHFFAGRRGDQR